MAGARVIAERYRLDEQVGEGGMGAVWRATDLELGRVVALKRSLSGDAGQVRREARIGAGVHHPGVVTVFDAFVHDGERWLVMEYLPSRSLAAILAADGPLSVPRAARIGAQIAEALAAIHAAGIVHRDITPGNVLVGDGRGAGGGDADGPVKLTDLGIARWAEVTVTGGAQLVGSPGYVAPEVADGREADAASDVFALGATLFAAVEGTSPWGGADSGPFVQLRRAATGRVEPVRHAGELAPVLGRLMERDPRRRPSAVEAGNLLRDAAAGVTVARVAPRRRRGRVLAAAGALAVLVGAGLYVALPRGGAAPVAPQAVTTVAGALGDPRTADPCSLLVPASVTRFGTGYLDPNLGHLSHCDLVVNLGGVENIVVVGLDFALPDEYAASATAPGTLGRVEGADGVGNSCERSIVLPSRDRVVIEARHVQEKPADLCAMAESVAFAARAVLDAGPILRRTVPVPADSSAGLDACALPRPAELAPLVVPGRENEPEPDFARWICYWGKDSDPRMVTVEFGREYPLEDDEDVDTRRVRLGGRLAFSDIRSNSGVRDECRILVVNRRYTPQLPGPPPQQREETVEVAVEDKGVADPETLCGPATTLARAIAGRLPPT